MSENFVHTYVLPCGHTGWNPVAGTNLIRCIDGACGREFNGSEFITNDLTGVGHTLTTASSIEDDSDYVNLKITVEDLQSGNHVVGEINLVVDGTMDEMKNRLSDFFNGVLKQIGVID